MIHHLFAIQSTPYSARPGPAAVRGRPRGAAARAEAVRRSVPRAAGAGPAAVVRGRGSPLRRAAARAELHARRVHVAAGAWAWHE